MCGSRPVDTACSEAQFFNSTMVLAKADSSHSVLEDTRSTAVGSNSTTSSRLASGEVTASCRSPIDTRSFMPEWGLNIPVQQRYNIDRRCFSAGGYGSVFFARDREFQDRLLVVKKISHVDVVRRDVRDREAAVMKELDHPNICKLFETFEAPAATFLVMERCEGGELLDRILEERALSEDLTASVLRQLCSAIKYSHTVGIAHRDIKPENVCFCSKDRSDSRVKLIDWGLAKKFTQTSMATSVGSPEYAAPEVMMSRGTFAYTSACDLWSLGIVTAVMLTGRPTFVGTFKERYQSMKNEVDIMRNSSWLSISDDAKSFVRGFLRFCPELRTQMDNALAHPFITRGEINTPDHIVAKKVFSSMQQFSRADPLLSLCAASAARQLEHQSLQAINAVFLDLDKDNDGLLDIEEVRAGFENAYGGDSEELQRVDAIFASVDLDRSGKMSYTEFCAAALGEEACLQNRSLWLAFKGLNMQTADPQAEDIDMEATPRRLVLKATGLPPPADFAAFKTLVRGGSYAEDGESGLACFAWLSRRPLKPVMRLLSNLKAVFAT